MEMDAKVIGCGKAEQVCQSFPVLRETSVKFVLYKGKIIQIHKMCNL